MREKIEEICYEYSEVSRLCRLRLPHKENRHVFDLREKRCAVGGLYRFVYDRTIHVLCATYCCGRSALVLLSRKQMDIIASVIVRY